MKTMTLAPSTTGTTSTQAGTAAHTASVLGSAACVHATGLSSSITWTKATAVSRAARVEKTEVEATRIRESFVMINADVAQSYLPGTPAWRPPIR